MDQHHTARDAQLTELRDRFLGWHAWYVPNAVTRSATWSAQLARYPLIADSPDDLAAMIEADRAPGASRDPACARRPE